MTCHIALHTCMPNSQVRCNNQKQGLLLASETFGFDRAYFLGLDPLFLSLFRFASLWPGKTTTNATRTNQSRLGPALHSRWTVTAPSNGM